MKRYYFSILICGVICVALLGSSNAKAQQLEYFLMKEGLEAAKVAAAESLSNPVLFAIMSVDNFSEGPAHLEMIYEGEDIGKSNNWVFAFTEADNEDEIAAFITMKINDVIAPAPYSIDEEYDYISRSNPIDESQLLDSDYFLKSLVGRSDFSRVSGDTIATFGVYSMKTDSLCFSSIENRWSYMTGLYDFETDAEVTLSCCSAPYFDVSELNCDWYDNGGDDPPDEPTENAEYFLLSEGIEAETEKAKEILGIDNPVLIAALYWEHSGDPVKLWDEETQTTVTYSGNLLFEGDDIGKANVWLYHFMNLSGVGPIAVIKTEEGLTAYRYAAWGWNNFYPYVQEIPIDLDNFEDSDVFVRKFVETEHYKDNKEAMSMSSDSTGYYTIGITSPVNYCFQPDTTLWGAYVLTDLTEAYYRGFCCTAQYNNVDELSCADFYVGIEESFASSINIFPIPASIHLFVENFEELNIISIEIFDVSGILVSEFASDSVVIDISNLSAGSYFICFTINNKKVYRPFVRE